MPGWSASEGLPYPLGVTWIEAERARNFALYSRHATRVTLLLYREEDLATHTPVFSYDFDYLTNKSGRIWHCRIPEAAVQGAVYYAYRIDGPPPGGPFEYNFYRPQKLLLDPYATSVFFPQGFSRSAAAGDGPNDGQAPLGRLPGRDGPYDWGSETCPRHESDLVIYELHVRQFTHNPNSGFSDDNRGTYAGLIEKIPYLKSLGITAVELMPVYQCDPQEGSAWGYMPLCFFIPHQGYAARSDATGPQDEFRDMVKALHTADIEVILDVVYNHTTEGNEEGPVYSFKGIDNSTYYLCNENAPFYFQNFFGAGNTLHTANAAVRGLILDSMRYWVREMHVDGFRFDLASVFSRDAEGAVNLDDPALFGQIASDPDLAGLRLIAEPWDATGVGYELGRSFPGSTWLQWNGRFRDDVRHFIKGDPGLVRTVMCRLYGSDDIFPDDISDSYHPFQSTNYVSCHDGPTMYDLVAYDSADGWGCGWQGEENVPAEVMDLRKRQIRNLCALLLLSNGTPMFRAGDEFLQTQLGQVNPYNVDNETVWLDWDRAQQHADIQRFFTRMIAFRKAHPSLCRSRFWRNDVTWHGVGHDPDLGPDSRSVAFCVRGASQGDDDVYAMVNAYWEPLTFGLTEPGPWSRVVDTSLPGPDDIREPGQEVPAPDGSYVVGPRSVVVLIRPGR